MARTESHRIEIDVANDVPIRQQLRDQIIFLIATGHMSHEYSLPSVRELARRLRIHHNTVSAAYQDLVKSGWLARRRGSRLVVVSREVLPQPQNAKSLDDIINLTIHLARAMGYPLQALRERVRDRLKAASPDHLLVIENDRALREILAEEIREALPYPVESCSQEELRNAPGLAIGALAVAPVYALGGVDALFPKERPVVSMTFSSADDHIQRIRKLRQPSTIAVVSTSKLFLDGARSILAPAIGRKHQLCEVLLPDATAPPLRAVDLMFCDSIARRTARLSGALHYQLITQPALEEIDNAMKSYQILV